MSFRTFVILVSMITWVVLLAWMSSSGDRYINRYTGMTYEEASSFAKSDIRKRMNRLSEIHCKKNIMADHRELMKLSLPRRVNHNTVSACIDTPDIERRIKHVKRTRYYRPIIEGDDDSVLIGSHYSLHNKNRKNEGKPLLFEFKDTEPFYYDHKAYSFVYNLYNDRVEACSVIYGSLANKVPVTEYDDYGLYCKMEIIDVTEPKVVYRNNINGNFVEYDYSPAPFYAGQELVDFNPAVAWDMLIHDLYPSRYPFVWRAEVTVKTRADMIVKVDWDWVEDFTPKTSVWIEPRWTVSGMRMLPTRWVGERSICHEETKACHTVTDK